MAPLDGLDLSYRVGDCMSCGFSYAYELPDDATYQRYYSTLSKYDVSATLSDSDNARFDAIVRLVREHLGNPDSSLVDIGCGEGALLSKLNATGYRKVYGVDPAPQASPLARQKYGLDSVRTGFFDNAGTVVPLTAADGVCISAVLEHLPNLRNDLQKLLAQLKPGSAVFIEVPTLELFGIGKGEPFGEFSLEHVNYFCRDTLNQLMRSLGWGCLHTEYLAFPSLDTGSVLAVYAHSTYHANLQTEQPPRLDRYIDAGNDQVRALLEQVPARDIAIWGAGSHTARILPLLQSNPDRTVRVLVDVNPNLIGKTLGGVSIQAPDALAAHPDLPVVISSFRSQNEISSRLRQRYPNPLVLLYP